MGKTVGRGFLGSMRKIKLISVFAASGLTLSACSFSTDALWPTLSGESTAAKATAPAKASPPKAPAPAVSAAPAKAAAPTATPPRLNTTDFKVKPPRDGAPTGTFVGRKVVQLRGDLGRLQSSITRHNNDLQGMRQQTIANASAFHARVGAIEARLQVGTTPGNPMLTNEWNQAQQQLGTVNADIGRMNNLANRVSADAAMSAYLLEATRAAYGLSGAIDEDHRQLAVLEDDVNKTVVLITRLLDELSEDIARQSTYVGNERGNLNTLALAIKNGELYGDSLATRSFAAASPAGGASMGGGFNMSGGGDRPLVVIRFDRANVKYQKVLYDAVSRVLERRPSARFELVAVSPRAGSTAAAALNTTAARKNAQAVLRALTDMGLSPDRVRLSAATAGDAASNEVRLFVR